jgi:leucyl-tRNA synthetase
MPREAAEKFTLMLAPFAPHLAEELWENLGHNDTLAYEKFPEYDEKVLEVSEVEILVQVLGRPKARLMMPVGCDADTAKAIALADATVKEAMNGKEPKKVIYVQNRLVNIVI